MHAYGKDKYFHEKVEPWILAFNADCIKVMPEDVGAFLDQWLSERVSLPKKPSENGNRTKPKRIERTLTNFRHTFSTFPDELRDLMRSNEFLLPVDNFRACRAHEADSNLMARLQELEVMDKNVDRKSFHGQFAVSRGSDSNLEAFIDKVDATLIYYKNSKLELRREAFQKHEKEHGFTLASAKTANLVGKTLGPSSTLADVDDQKWLHEIGLMDTLNIAIVGGGPTGLMCAIEAAILGHHVEVIEARPSAVRARAIGLYPETMVTLCRIGAPAEMFNDNFLWCDKAGVTIFDLEFFLAQIALKLGVTIYRNATAIVTDSIAHGILKVRHSHESGRTVYSEYDEFGMVRMRHGVAQRLAMEEFELSFDKIVNCEGSAHRSFAEHLTGDKAKASAPVMATAADVLDVLGNDRQRYLSEWDDHIDKVINEVDWAGYTQALRSDTVPHKVNCFVCNMPRQVFKEGPRANGGGNYEAPHLMSRCPVDWIGIPIPPNLTKSLELLGATEANFVSKGQLNTVAGDKKAGAQEPPKGLAASFGLEDKLIDRIHFEGIFPANADQALKGKEPAEVLKALFRACDVSDDIDDAGLARFISAECSFTSAAQNAVGVFDAAPVALRTQQGLTTMPQGNRAYAQMAHGFVPGSRHRNQIEYYILGDSLCSAWYRWGVGVLDAIVNARFFGQSLLQPSYKGRSMCIKQLEERMAIRTVQTSAYFYHFSRLLSNDARMLRVVKELESAQAAAKAPSTVKAEPGAAVIHW